MNNEVYVDISNTTDNIKELITVDNGKTWGVSGYNNFVIINEHNNKLYGSVYNGGVKVGNGLSWQQTKITKGTYYGMSYPYFAGDGIYDIDGNEIIGKENKFTDIVLTEDGEPLAIGDDGAFNISKREWEIVGGSCNLFTTPNAKSTSGLMLNLSSHLLSDKEINNLVLIIINKIVYPRICNDLLGTRNFLNDTGYVTFKGGQHKRFVFGAEDVYKIHRFSSIIDWENDVGMRPFGTPSIRDLIYNDDSYVQDYPLNDINEIKENEKTKKLIKVVFHYISNRRQEVFDYWNKKISAIAPDREIVNEIIEHSSPEMKDSNLEFLSHMIESEKGTVKLLLSDYFTKVFTFDEFTIKSLINAAIYESVRETACSIRYDLIKMNREQVAANVMTQTRFDYETFEFSYDFASGLRKALNTYINAVYDNAKKLNTNNDKDLISEAVNYYKSVEKIDLIKRTEDYTLNTKFFDESYTINVCQSMMNEYTSLVKEYISNNPSVSREDKKDYLINLFKSTYNNINKEEMFEYYFNSYKNELQNALNTKLRFKYFENGYESLKDSYSDIEIARIYGYLEEIHMKFIDRVIMLIDYLLKDFSKSRVIVNNINSMCMNDINNKVIEFIDKAIDNDEYFISHCDMSVVNIYKKNWEEFNRNFIVTFKKAEGMI